MIGEALLDLFFKLDQLSLHLWVNVPLFRSNELGSGTAYFVAFLGEPSQLGNQESLRRRLKLSCFKFNVRLLLLLNAYKCSFQLSRRQRKIINRKVASFLRPVKRVIKCGAFQPCEVVHTRRLFNVTCA